MEQNRSPWIHCLTSSVYRPVYQTKSFVTYSSRTTPPPGAVDRRTPDSARMKLTRGAREGVSDRRKQDARIHDAVLPTATGSKKKHREFKNEALTPMPPA